VFFGVGRSRKRRGINQQGGGCLCSAFPRSSRDAFILCYQSFSSLLHRWGLVVFEREVMESNVVDLIQTFLWLRRVPSSAQVLAYILPDSLWTEWCVFFQLSVCLHMIGFITCLHSFWSLQQHVLIFNPVSCSTPKQLRIPSLVLPPRSRSTWMWHWCQWIGGGNIFLRRCGVGQRTCTHIVILITIASASGKGDTHPMTWWRGERCLKLIVVTGDVIDIKVPWSLRWEVMGWGKTRRFGLAQPLCWVA
jgi:hypothetical protein